jgi:hypothetical protein
MAATAPAAAEAARSSATLLFEACVSARHRVTPEIVRYVANKIYRDMIGMQALPPLAGQISDETGKVLKMAAFLAWPWIPQDDGRMPGRRRWHGSQAISRYV